ncbi:tol-pal system protein YbgF [Rhodovulum sp. 12E13]|uniref:tol-pal system protein YbgF n=1 Tax=Rhodovulum sp. 12E13 TaxID=2203891 RepID=UPI000E11F718|nr:tol-pal system protein YbgF [Rhodovulum sp. 12E13]RDC73308.1 tol-pal system protein YbgF [Rhodovulum sp. 12E13]
MRRAAALLIAAACALPGTAPAQDGGTLADIRQDLAALYVEIQRLNRELSTTGGPGVPQASGSLIERVDLIEQELQRLTARAEELSFRIQQVVQDGTNRIGDLEFRLCELEPSCDIGALRDTPTLGGPVPEAPPPAITPAPESDGPQMAVGEREDFERARAALEAGDNAEAARLFARHVQTYPGGPLTGEAHFLRGRALDALGQTADAARAFLEAFSQAPSGPNAPAALLALGQKLGALGQTQDACVTLGEVQSRFPGSDAAGQAAAELSRLGCG